MAKQKHTPGPWRAQRNSAFWEIVPAEGAGDGDVPFTIGDVCASAPDYPDRGLQEANAHLIAAAPDLLEALQELVAIRESDGDEWHGSGRLVDALEDARHAIAKAEGRAS